MEITRYARLEGRRIYGGGTIRIDGEVRVCYWTLAFGKRCFTFDLGQTWSTNMQKAAASATVTNPAGEGARPEGEAMPAKKTAKTATKKMTKKQIAELHKDTDEAIADRVKSIHASKKEKISKGLAEAVADTQPNPATTDPDDPLCVFAFRLTKAERDEIHAAAGPGKASSFVKAMALGVARGDMKPIQEAVDRIHCK